MSAAWPTVPLGDLLRRSERTVLLHPETTYKEVTVRMNGKGVVERRQVQGIEIASDRRYEASAGQFIISRIDARNGASGLIPDELDGAVVTNDFPLFDVAKDRLEPAFLNWMSKTASFVDLCKRASEGTTNRVRLSEDRFKSLEIALPSLCEQRRIVARIEELAEKVEEARGLRQLATVHTGLLISLEASARLDSEAWPRVELRSVLAEKPRNGLSPKPQVDSGGRPMLRINAVSSSPTRYVDTDASKSVDVADAEADPFILQNNDVFIVRYNGDINRVAKAAIYKGYNDKRIVYPDKLIRLRPNPERMTPDFLVYALGSRTVRAQIEELGRTTAGNIGVSGGDAQSFIVPLPPVSAQHRIVAELDALQTKVASVEALQSETATELDAMLPAILDKAFKGELA